MSGVFSAGHAAEEVLAGAVQTVVLQNILYIMIRPAAVLVRKKRRKVAANSWLFGKKPYLCIRNRKDGAFGYLG